jgi:uncharacterized protein YcbK (DUF882 family)
MAFERLLRRNPLVAAADTVPATCSTAIPENSTNSATRRGLLLGLGAAAAVAASGVLTPKAVLAAAGGPRKLRLTNMNTGESFDSVYWRDGSYVPESLQKLNILLRDHRANEVHRIDPGLFDLLASVGQRLGAPSFQIVSAYRAPRTNAMRATESRGVAQNSYHIQGMALDIRLPGHDLRGIYKTAVSMSQGGVGFYRRSGFVHIDTGPIRTWG